MLPGRIFHPSGGVVQRGHLVKVLMISFLLKLLKCSFRFVWCFQVKSFPHVVSDFLHQHIFHGQRKPKWDFHWLPTSVVMLYQVACRNILEIRNDLMECWAFCHLRSYSKFKINFCDYLCFQFVFIVQLERCSTYF